MRRQGQRRGFERNLICGPGRCRTWVCEHGMRDRGVRERLLGDRILLTGVFQDREAGSGLLSRKWTGPALGPGGLRVDDGIDGRMALMDASVFSWIGALADDGR